MMIGVCIGKVDFSFVFVNLIKIVVEIDWL